jgi:hypothetical protein
MSSKKFRGKRCVYCVEAAATTSDHVIGRKFFLGNRRDNLPQVPSCRSCNCAKSELENYLMVVLPFGAHHPDASVNLQTMIPKRLDRNARLKAELEAGFTQSGGVTIPFDHVRFNKLFAMIAQGLLWYHWRTLLGHGFSAIAAIFSDLGSEFFNEMAAKLDSPNRVVGNLGEGTFCYKGYQASSCPQVSVWRFSMYGGVTFAGDRRLPGPATLVVAFTGRDAIIERLQRTPAEFRTDRNLSWL